MAPRTGGRFHPADPERRRAVTARAATTQTDNATAPPAACDALYGQVRAYLARIMARPVSSPAPPTRG